MARISLLILVSQPIVQNMQHKSRARLFIFLILKWVHIKYAHPPDTRNFSPHAPVLQTYTAFYCIEHFKSIWFPCKSFTGKSLKSGVTFFFFVNSKLEPIFWIPTLWCGLRESCALLYGRAEIQTLHNQNCSHGLWDLVIWTYFI